MSGVERRWAEPRDGARSAGMRACHRDTLTSRNNLAMSYWAAGRTVEAILLLERSLADSERVLGADHPNTKAARKDLAALTGEPEGTGT